MTLDTSAVLAILQDEAERTEFVALKRMDFAATDIALARPL